MAGDSIYRVTDLVGTSKVSWEDERAQVDDVDEVALERDREQVVELAGDEQPLHPAPDQQHAPQVTTAR